MLTSDPVPVNLQSRSRDGGIGWRHRIQSGALHVVVSREGDTVGVTEGDDLLTVFRLMEDQLFERFVFVATATSGFSRYSNISSTAEPSVSRQRTKRPNVGGQSAGDTCEIIGNSTRPVRCVEIAATTSARIPSPAAVVSSAPLSFQPWVVGVKSRYRSLTDSAQSAAAPSTAKC
jgi:hypothetical protein